jgi:hypothetical protein
MHMEEGLSRSEVKKDADAIFVGMTILLHCHSGRINTQRHILQKKRE